MNSAWDPPKIAGHWTRKTLSKRTLRKLLFDRCDSMWNFGEVGLELDPVVQQIETNKMSI